MISYRWSKAGEPPRLRVRHYSHTDTLGSVISVSPAAHELSLFDELAGDLDGDAVLTWGRWTSGGTQVFARSISSTGALGTVTRLGAGDWPKVALDDDGDGLITWQAPSPDFSTSQVHARTIGQDGAFGAAEILAPDGATRSRRPARRADSRSSGRRGPTRAISGPASVGRRADPAPSEERHTRSTVVKNSRSGVPARLLSSIDVALRRPAGREGTASLHSGGRGMIE
ncbi:hypothetical protein GCM10027614_79130 [Micromonospora vulcania]